MLACIGVFFNPAKYKSTLKNYYTFREHFTKRLPLYIVEASFDGNFETDAQFKIRANSSNQIMWQKERMINWIVNHLPDKFDRYMYSDCDLLYPNEFTDMILEKTGIVQCFGEINFLDETGKVFQTKNSALKWQLDNIGNYGCPGGAWMYPRDIQQYDRAIIGAGDSLIERALLGKEDTWPAKILTTHEYQYYKNWSKFLNKKENLSYLNISIKHLYHGTRENRQYIHRHIILKEENYNPVIDVQIAKNGLLSWSTFKPKLHSKIKDYFLSRKEDD